MTKPRPILVENLEIGGTYLAIHYTYWPGFPGTREQPPEGPEYGIEKVMVNTVDVSSLLDALDAIEPLIEKLDAHLNDVDNLRGELS